MKIRIVESSWLSAPITLGYITFHQIKDEETAKKILSYEWDNFHCGEPDSDSQFIDFLCKRGYDASEEDEEIVVDFNVR